MQLQCVVPKTRLATLSVKTSHALTRIIPDHTDNTQLSLRTVVAHSGGPWGQRIVVGVARNRQQADHEVEPPSHASHFNTRLIKNR